MTIKQATNQDIEAIMQLQEKYHVSNLTEAEKQSKGFVTMKIALIQYQELVSKGAIFIALTNEGKVAAYASSGDWAYWGDSKILQTMENAMPNFQQLSEVLTVENTCHYGPVCIDEAYRGKDILTQLFSSVQTFYAPYYPFIITFINKQNERSMRAHAKKTPLSIVGDFRFNGNEYWALAAEI